MKTMEKDSQEFDSTAFSIRFLTSLAEQYAHQHNAKLVEGSLEIKLSGKDETA